MTIVAGVDFGTQSVRVSLVDHVLGVVGSGVADYPVHRTPGDPDFATQSHAEHMRALGEASRQALQLAGVSGDAVRALALDTTGSTVVPVGEGLEPLDDYYLWCDHRAKNEAARITELALEHRLPAIQRCGGVYSAEWGFAKLLHWLRHNRGKRDRFVTALEHCDMVAATLCGITQVDELPRSVCAMGHKWLWLPEGGGLPPESFLCDVDPLLAGVRERLGGRYRTSLHLAGTLAAEWAARLGLQAGIPIPIGAFDAHWDALGAGIAEGDVVNVVGTSTCTMAIARTVGNVPGVCGVVQGSVHPDFVGIEAGLSGTGNIYEAIAARAGTTVRELSAGLDTYRAAQTGLLRLPWDNGDRTVLVNTNLGGVTLGWTLATTARDDLFAAIEGTALHTRIVLERMATHGVRIERIILGGGIPQENEVLNRVYANVLDKPILVPSRPITSLGAAIVAFVAAGTFATIEEAQRALCPSHRVVRPDPAQAALYRPLYLMFRALYYALGSRDAPPVSLGAFLPLLRSLAASARSPS